MGKKFCRIFEARPFRSERKRVEEWTKTRFSPRDLTEREGCPSFVFFEGPPSANGMPGHSPRNGWLH